MTASPLEGAKRGFLSCDSLVRGPHSGLVHSEFSEGTLCRAMLLFPDKLADVRQFNFADLCMVSFGSQNLRSSANFNWRTSTN